MQKIDQIDKNILKHLQQDASLTIEALAQAVHCSRNACWRRVQKLESAGLIKKRVALLDARLLDLGLSVFVLIRAKEHSQNWLEAFKKAVADFPEITGAYRMTGDLDYLLMVRVKDVAGYDGFYQRLIIRLPGSDISASFVMEEIKETTELPL